jgi:hypothetical protein
MKTEHLLLIAAIGIGWWLYTHPRPAPGAYVPGGAAAGAGASQPYTIPQAQQGPGVAPAGGDQTAIGIANAVASMFGSVVTGAANYATTQAQIDAKAAEEERALLALEMGYSPPD